MSDEKEINFQDALKEYMDKTWVHDGKEFVMTGRTAKKLPTGAGRPKILMEIAPLGADPSDKTYCKWVDIKDLFLVNE